MLMLLCQIIVFTKYWKQTTAIHIAEPHTARVSFRIWEIKGNSAKMTPMKLPMGVMGYGVSPFMSAPGEGLVKMIRSRDRPNAFYTGIQKLLSLSCTMEDGSIDRRGRESEDPSQVNSSLKPNNLEVQTPTFACIQSGFREHSYRQKSTEPKCG